MIAEDFLDLLHISLHLGDYKGDDALLLLRIRGAMEEVESLTGRTNEELQQLGGGDEWPASLSAAVVTIAHQAYADADFSGNYANYRQAVMNLVTPSAKLT